MSLRPNPIGGDPAQFPPGAKPRRGCLGCLGQLVWQSAVALVLGSILLLAMTGLFYPWAFYLGGKFHILPYWQGWAKLHAKSGDYVLFVRFEPTPRRSQIIPHSNLRAAWVISAPPVESSFGSTWVAA